MSTDTTKYGSQITDAWRWSCEHDITLSDHIINDRWDERTPYDSVAPEVAWERGAPVRKDAYAFFEDRDGKRPDEVRVFHEHDTERSYQVAMLARGGVIRTVYNARMYTPPVRAFLNAYKPFVETEEADP